MASNKEKLTDPSYQFKVEPADAKKRLDIFLSEALKKQFAAEKKLPPSRSRIAKSFDENLVRVNGKIARRGSLQLKAGDIIDWTGLSPQQSDQLKPVDLKIDVLYEDEHLLVVNKPAGMTVHPGAGTREPTLVSGLLFHVKSLSKNATRPGIVHRLDKDTSGAMVVAKSDEVHEALAKQFKDKSNIREYLAILEWLGSRPQPKWEKYTQESYLTRDKKTRVKFVSVAKNDYAALLKKAEKAEGESALAGYRYAKSYFSCVKTYRHRLSLARIRLATGRTHQIRLHAKDLKMPVVGDLVYHRPTLLPIEFDKSIRQHFKGISRQMLHAMVLGFKHPISGKELVFEAPMPNDMKLLLELLAPYEDL